MADARKLGGGLLVLVAAAVPVIVGKMNFQLSAHEGVLLLWACGIVGLIGLLLVLWPKAEAAAQRHSEKEESPRSTFIKSRAGGSAYRVVDSEITADTFLDDAGGSDLTVERTVFTQGTTPDVSATDV